MTLWKCARAVLISGIILMLAANASAQSKDDLIGTWKLISSKDTTDKGEVRDSFGPHPAGLITYTADGRMMAIITEGGRKPLSVADYVAAPVEERAEAFATLTAYAGRYTFAGNRVIHHVEIASMQNRVGMNQVRFIVSLRGKRLTLRTTPFLRGGEKISKEELVWERLTPQANQ